MQAILHGIEFPKLDVCWLAAPDEFSPAFLPAYARISVAIQTALREHVPSAYFENSTRFRDVRMAYPMLVYQASRPFRGRIRTDLTYDVLNPKTLASLFRNAKKGLIEPLARAEARLRAEGLEELGASYAGKRAAAIIHLVQKWSRSRKSLYVLIRAEGVLLNALIDLGGLEALAPKLQARRKAAFKKKWSFQLRRLYPGTDFLWLAPALLDAASQALRSFQNTRTCDSETEPRRLRSGSYE